MELGWSLSPSSPWLARVLGVETGTVTESLQSSITYAAPSGAGNNITFTFDKSYYCGQYANGDWWVRPDTPGGTVTITAMSPVKAQRGDLTYMHGWEVNPNSIANQGFDSDATMVSWIPYSTARQTALPIVITGSSTPTSIVKSVSNPTNAQRPQLIFSAVLTVVNSGVVDSANKLRPPYFGSNKPTISVSSAIATNLGIYPVTGTNYSALAFTTIRDNFKYLRMQHLQQEQGRYIAGSDNFPNTGYGNNVALNHHEAIGRFLGTDFDYSIASHKDALHNALQAFVDLASCAVGGTVWPANGGHNLGKKLPILFAKSVLTGNSTYFGTAISTHEASTQFQEDGHVYASAATDGSNNADALFGKIPSSGTLENNYWGVQGATGNGAISGPKDTRDPYAKVDGMVDPASPYYFMGDSYQGQVSQSYAHVDAMTGALGLYNEWDSVNGTNAPIFKYARRWRAFGAWASPDNIAPYDGVPSNYFSTYGNGITGAGRKTSLHGTMIESTAYRSLALNDFWTWWQTYDAHSLVFTAVTGASISTQYASNLSRVNAVGTITAVSGVEYQITSDKAGTAVVVAWGTGTTQAVSVGQYISVRLTTGSSGLTAYTGSITVSGSTSTYSVTTQYITLFANADSSYASTTQSAHSKITITSGGSGLSATVNQKRMVVAIRYKCDSGINDTALWAKDANFNIRTRSATHTVRFYPPATSCTCDFAVTTTTTTDRILLLSLDTTQATAAAGFAGYKYEAGSWSAALTQSGTLWTQNNQFAESALALTTLLGYNADTNLLDGGIEWLWVWVGQGTDSMPDVTDSAVRDAFAAISPTGTTTIAGITPKMFVGASAVGATDGSTPSTWNATAGIPITGQWADANHGNPAAVRSSTNSAFYS